MFCLVCRKRSSGSAMLLACCVQRWQARYTTYHNDGTGKGVNFRVVDVDTFRFNEVVGRCFCSATVMQQAMESNTPIVMSLGEGYAYSI